MTEALTTIIHNGRLYAREISQSSFTSREEAELHAQTLKQEHDWIKDTWIQKTWEGRFLVWWLQ